MNKEFNKIIDFILKSEGGYVNDPNDPGGETNYGISKRAYPKIDIKNLSVTQAKEIYFNDYWLKSRAPELPKELRHIHLDTAVNTGIIQAAKILQESIGGINVDGIIGSQTLKNVKKTSKYKYALYRLKFYNSLVSKKPNLLKFLNGWTKRVVEIINRRESVRYIELKVKSYKVES